MSDSTGVRWYRYGGDRWALVILYGALGAVIAAPVVITGIARPGLQALIIVGAAILIPCVAGVRLMLRAGIGVTPEHVLVRNGLGHTEMIPWANITGFEVRKHGRGLELFVFGVDGNQWHTIACSPGGFSQREIAIQSWRLLRALEDERLAWVPGAASELPRQPPGPGTGLPPQRWGVPVFMGIAIAGFMALGGVLAYQGITGIGPALRASSGEGTAGYFIPQKVYSKSDPTGEFRLLDGAVILRNVTLSDSGYTGSTIQVGVPVPARDTGGGAVFPRDDPGAWGGAVHNLVSGFSVIALFLAPGISSWMRRGRAMGRSAELR